MKERFKINTKKFRVLKKADVRKFQNLSNTQQILYVSHNQDIWVMLINEFTKKNDEL